MSKYNDTILTTEGTRLATLAANGKTHYVITRAVATGDDLSDLTDEQLAALTKLPNEVQEGSIVEQVDDPSGSDGVIGTRVQFMNQGLSKSYSMNALGVYAKEDGHDQEVLFSVMTAESQHAQYMPDFADKVVLRFDITIFVIVGDKANVTVKLDPDGLATIKFVEDAIARIPKPDMTEYYSKKESDTLLNKKVTDNGDDTVTINGKTYIPANDANMFHRSPDTGAVTESGNFPGLQVKGVSVATSDDLKSLEASAWRPIISNNYSGLCMMKYNADTETMSLSGTIFPKTYSTEGSRVAVIIPMPEGFSMGENTDSKTTIWTNATGSVQKFAGIVADLKYESDGIHIIFDKIYSNYPDPKMFIILDDFFAYSTANPQSNNLINFKVTKN
ncbi:hypothetical protein ACLOEZ_10570 [Levilactobacillus brevis]|uniref:hypothetical protein n=1 Tax=Levilactobacillus brevis TaxID=1580 RepID=UPI003EBF2F9B